MKTTSSIIKTIALFLFAGAVFFSCSLFDSGDYGTLLINLPGSGSSRATGDTISDDFTATLSYVVDCKGQGSVTREFRSGGVISIPLYAGDWVVTVTVLNIAGEEIGKSTSSVTIEVGKTATVPLSISIDTSRNEIKRFVITSPINRVGVINGNDITISVPSGTDISGMGFSVLHTGRSITHSPIGDTLDFQNDATYTFSVQAENLDIPQKSYTVKVELEGDDGIEDGTLSNPYIVKDEPTLRKVGTGNDGWDMDKHYKMAQNVTLTVAGGGDWTPIGDATNHFTGTFDGNGKTISDLKINNTTYDTNQGMFGYIDGGTVKNLGLIDVNITVSNDNIGGLAGYNEGLIENCYVTGTINSEVTGGGMYVGGIAGFNTGTIQNCYSTATIATDSFISYGGGIAGWNRGTIQNCYATGSVGGGGSNSGTNGGIAGNSMYDYPSTLSTVTNCVALNSNITGDFLARIFDGQAAPSVMNYGRSDMQENGSTGSWISAIDANHGEDITATEYGDEEWWKTPGTWGTADGAFAWDFSSSGPWGWNGTTNLPILKNVGGAQNHTVP